MQKQMPRAEADAIADESLNHAVALIQARIGQTDGGFAALYLGDKWPMLVEILSGYIQAEISNGGNTQ